MTFHFPFHRYCQNTATALDKIISFADLPPGWHYGEGVPASKEMVTRASAIFYFLTQIGFTKADAFPVEDGSILVTAYYRSSYIGVEVEASGGYSVKEQIEGSETMYYEHANLRELRSTLLSASKKAIWTTLGSFTRINTTILNNNSTIRHSRRPLAEGECLS